MTDAIEAGARAVPDETIDVALTAWYEREGPTDTNARSAMRAAIEAAIASGALVPASAVVEMRERCAKAAQNAFAETIANYALIGPGGMARQMVNAIRQLDLSPACGEYVVGWRTMDSAPKDGSKIIYHNGDSMDPVIGYCQWSSWPEEDNFEAWWDYERDTEACPKFWMPEIALPKPPLHASTRTGGGK